MAACPEIYQCGLHRNISMREALRVWQSFYCEGAFRRCERFKLATSGMKVPEKLLPNGRLVAEGEAPRSSENDERNEPSVTPAVFSR